MENQLREMFWNCNETVVTEKCFEQLVITEAKLFAIEETVWTLSKEAREENLRNLPFLIQDIRKDLISLGKLSAFIEDYIFTLSEPEEYERSKSEGYDMLSKHNI